MADPSFLDGDWIPGGTIAPPGTVGHAAVVNTSGTAVLAAYPTGASTAFQFLVGDQLVALKALTTTSVAYGKIAGGGYQYGAFESGTPHIGVLRTVNDRLQDTVSLLDFGAPGLSDYTTAFTNALATGKSIHVPAGTYPVLSGPIKITKPGQVIYGDGPRVTTITPTGNFDVFAFNGITVTVLRAMKIARDQKKKSSENSNLNNGGDEWNRTTDLSIMSAAL